MSRADKILEQLTGPQKKTRGRKVLSDPSIADLQIQNLQKDLQIKAMGGKSHKGGPSLLSRAFDVLSRGQYASAGAVQAALGKGGRSGIGGSLIDALTGAKKGLEGKRKASYSQVLEEHGVKNKLLSTTVGLVGDIALDPTTYLGAGLVKGVGKAAAEGSKAVKVAEALNTATKAGTLKHVEDEARTAFRMQEFLAGAETPTKKAVGKAGKEARIQAEERIANEASKAALQELPDKLAFKFAGKTFAESEKAAKVLELPGKALGKTHAGQNLKTLFSNTSGILDEPRKMFLGRSIAEFEDYAKQPIFHHGGKGYTWETLGKVFTKDELSNFSKAYEAGLVHELQPAKSGASWDALVDAVDKENKRLYAHDVGEGLIDPTKTPPVENYLYHHYEVPEGKAAGFKAKRTKAIASDSYKPGLERQIHSLQAAEDSGLKPITDIRAIMLKRAAKTYSGTARRNYIMDAIDELGIRDLEGSVAKTMNKKGHDLVNVKSYLSSSLKKGDKSKLLSFLDGTEYLPREVAKHLGAADRVFHAPEEIDGLLHLYDKVLSKWRAVATVYNPGHHMRNLSTDIFLNFLDGVKNPQIYQKSMDLLFHEKNLEGTIKIGKQSVPKIDILRAFKESGAAPGWIVTNVDEGGKLFKGTITRALHEGSGKREEFGRLAHFLDSLAKESKGKNLRDLKQLQEASNKAAARVRHWNIDYTDLTPFERNVMKRLVPFYTWTRHSTPLMLEAVATRPGKVASVPKVMSALSKLMGNQDEALPIDLIPKWLREAGAAQIGENNGNPRFMSPFFFPGAETAQLFEGGRTGVLNNLSGIGANLLAQTSPLIRGPVELGTGRTFYGNLPVDSTSEYLKNQIPALRNFNTIMATKDIPDKNDMTTRLLNYLMGAGLYEVTPNRIRGELRRQMDPKEAYLRKARGNQR